MPRDDAAKRSIVESAASAPSSWAARILEKQGWKEGRGLGKNEDGAVAHVKVVKKDDTMALGFREVALRATSGGDQWWLGDDPFAKARVGGAAADADGGKRRKKRARSGSCGSDGSGVGARAPAGEDVQAFYKKLFEATGGARLGMRARREQPGKWERAEAALAGGRAGDAPDAAAEKAARKAAKKAARRAEREAAEASAAADAVAVAEDGEAAAAKRARKEAKRAQGAR